MRVLGLPAWVAVVKLTVTLPLPPSLNNLYPTVRGRRVLSEEGRQYHHDAEWIIVDAARKAAWRTRPGQRYRLELVLYWSDLRRRDLSNTIKIVEDSTAAALGFDDTRIDELVVRRGPVDKERPRCELRIVVLSGALGEGGV